jgi:predicted nucleic acid-binding protein
VTTCFDTSAAFRLVVREPGSSSVAEIWDRAEDPAASAIGYVELRSALARTSRDGRVREERIALARRDLDELWQQFARVRVNEGVIGVAGQLAERHALSALDAIHLASALSLREPGDEVTLVTFDRRMREAALAEGLTVRPEAS